MRALIYASILALIIIALPEAMYSQSNLEDPPVNERLDHRIYLHYSEAQIQDIQQNHPNKIKQLNYYYQQSWYIMPNPNCPECAAIDPRSFDVQDYEHLREWGRKNTFQLEYPSHFIVLKPRKELQEIYSTLQ